MKNKKAIFTLLMMIFMAGFAERAYAQGWSFTFTTEVSGPCGTYKPQLPVFTIPFMPDKSTCESIRQTVVNISASQPMYDSHGNYIGDCKAYISASPCNGSDAASASGTPGSVSIDGLVAGSPFFSPHDTRSLENWINNYMLKLKAMGVAFNEDNFITAQDIPLTGVESFDKKYADEVLRFEYPEQGGVVDLSGKQGVVDINNPSGQLAATNPPSENTEGMTVPVMGSAPLTAEERERINAYNLKSVPDNRLDDSNFSLEESPFWNTPEMKELGVDAAKFAIGTATGGLGYTAIVGVDVVAGIATDKSAKQIAIDVATDVASKGIGDLGGMAVSKGTSVIGKINPNVTVTPAAAKATYEKATEYGQMVIDSWTNASKVDINGKK
ncbi:MAG TPA: hypothetical protein PKH02_02335 [Bacteroidales bacterium]|nr:hypothetical protein [Bacteroidales bacterium]HPT11452.1 hypothetical protein [Bacteroidales bacterium]